MLCPLRALSVPNPDLPNDLRAIKKEEGTFRSATEAASELQKTVEGISQRMLTTTLRQLERDGLLSRELFPEEPPRVEYELTDLGLSLLEPMRKLVQWIGSNWEAIKRAREGFDILAR